MEIEIQDKNTRLEKLEKATIDTKIHSKRHGN